MKLQSDVCRNSAQLIRSLSKCDIFFLGQMLIPNAPAPLKTNMTLENLHFL